ncbi:MAG: hypothetical protein H0Z34_17270 [Brevibacillus sp.]|nr:hypothetical protein [Brevibacillus sp.]
MVKIYEIVKWKQKRAKEWINFVDYLRRTKEQLRGQPATARGKPVEVLTINELRRLMGDVG